MAKVKNEPVTEETITEYLDTCSDFAFELQILQMLTSERFKCEHGGTYVDPVTGKSRQFDLRATITPGPWDLKLAVECKNLKQCFPLVVECTPRTEDESFHEVVLSFMPEKLDSATNSGKPMRIEHGRSLYVRNEPVGKSCNRVGRHEKEGTVEVENTELYEKWSQAINSAYDLANVVYDSGWRRQEAFSRDDMKFFLAFVLPVVVVPDRTLWKVSYESNGSRTAKPVQTDRCSYFIGKPFKLKCGVHSMDYWISHLEFVTVTGLLTLVRSLTNTDGIMMRRVIPDLDEIKLAIAKERKPRSQFNPANGPGQ